MVGGGGRKDQRSGFTPARSSRTPSSPSQIPKASQPPFLQFSMWGITWWILESLAKEREQQSARDLLLFLKSSFSYS